MCGAGLCSTLRYRLPCNESGWLDIQRTIPEDGCKHTQIPESCSWEGCQSEHHTQIPESCCWEGWQASITLKYQNHAVGKGGRASITLKNVMSITAAPPLFGLRLCAVLCVTRSCLSHRHVLI